MPRRPNGYLVSDDPIERQWKTWRHSLDGNARERAREQLIIHYAPLAKDVAMLVEASWTARMARAVRTSRRPLHRSDLVSFGMFGLIESVTNYEPGHDDGFEAYARRNIEHAIRYELEALGNGRGMWVV
jgi:DNA-directed RNA polymerase specialized sigma subunit